MAINMKINERVRGAILRALVAVGDSAGASVVRSYLQAEGVTLQERTIRLYFLRMDQEGLTRLVSRRAGRLITERGREELARDKVIEKVGFTASHLDAQAYRTSFDLKTRKGMLASLSVRVPKASLLRAMEEMKYVFSRRLGAGSNVVVAKEAERLAGPVAISGLIEVATLSSVSLTSVLVTGGIPVVPRFGGLLEIHEGRALRFVELIDYRGSTIDPVELFVRAKMTRIRDCARTGSGLVGAGFLEIPSVALPAAQQLCRVAGAAGLGVPLGFGLPGQAFLGIPVPANRGGLAVLSGANPLAALYEAGVISRFEPYSGVIDSSRFEPFHEVRNRLTVRL
jgi:repressor of nif and glnA expression